MSSTHFFTFFLVFAVLESVFGATCKNSNTTTCVATTYTSATCDGTTKICGCNSGTVAIPTGCGAKLSAPTLSWPAGYSSVVLDGKTATLTCTSAEGANLFEWFLNDASLTTTTTNTYTTGAITATANLGPYKCKAKISGLSSLDSDLSNAVTFTVLAKTASTVTPLPTISTLPTKSFLGKSVSFSCTNVPIGYDLTKVVITDKDAKTLTSPVTISSTNQGTTLKCELTDFPTSHSVKITGPDSNLPTQTSDVTTPITIVTTALNNDIYNKDATVTLKCETTPYTAYVDTSIITWAWLKDTTPISGATAQTYVLPVEDGTYNIKCQVTTTTTTTPMLSDPITIKRDNALLTKQSIVANPTTPVLYSRLTLACGSSAVDGASYSWKKDSTDIARQFDRIIQIDNVTTSENGAYACTVTKSKVTLTSDAFTVNVSAGQEMVKISMLVLGLTLLMSKVFA